LTCLTHALLPADECASARVCSPRSSYRAMRERHPSSRNTTRLRARLGSTYATAGVSASWRR
jgi:hypothetical protein